MTKGTVPSLFPSTKRGEGNKKSPHGLEASPFVPSVPPSVRGLFRARGVQRSIHIPMREKGTKGTNRVWGHAVLRFLRSLPAQTPKGTEGT